MSELQICLIDNIEQKKKKCLALFDIHIYGLYLCYTIFSAEMSLHFIQYITIKLMSIKQGYLFICFYFVSYLSHVGECWRPSNSSVKLKEVQVKRSATRIIHLGDEKQTFRHSNNLYTKEIINFRLILTLELHVKVSVVTCF